MLSFCFPNYISKRIYQGSATDMCSPILQAYHVNVTAKSNLQPSLFPRYTYLPLLGSLYGDTIRFSIPAMIFSAVFFSFHTSSYWYFRFSIFWTSMSNPSFLNQALRSAQARSISASWRQATIGSGCLGFGSRRHLILSSIRSHHAPSQRLREFSDLPTKLENWSL